MIKLSHELTFFVDSSCQPYLRAMAMASRRRKAVDAREKKVRSPIATAQGAKS